MKVICAGVEVSRNEGKEVPNVVCIEVKVMRLNWFLGRFSAVFGKMRNCEMRSHCWRRHQHVVGSDRNVAVK